MLGATWLERLGDGSEQGDEWMERQSSIRGSKCCWSWRRWENLWTRWAILLQEIGEGKAPLHRLWQSTYKDGRLLLHYLLYAITWWTESFRRFVCITEITDSWSWCILWIFAIEATRSETHLCAQAVTCQLLWKENGTTLRVEKILLENIQARWYEGNKESLQKAKEGWRI